MTHHILFIPPAHAIHVRVLRRVADHADLVARLRREAEGLRPEEAYNRIDAFLRKNVGTAAEPEEDEQLVDNLRASAISGTVSAASIYGAYLLANSGHGLAASAAAKFGLSAAIPWAYYTIKAWRVATGEHKRAYTKGLAVGASIAGHLPKEVLKKLARDAAVAKDHIDPYKSGFSRGLLHALLEAMK